MIEAMFEGALYRLTTVAALLGILMVAQQPMLRADAAARGSTDDRHPAEPRPSSPVDGPDGPDESGDPKPGDPAPGEGADAPSPLTLRDGVPSAMLDRLRSSSVARADELISANRGAAVACGSPDPSTTCGPVFGDAVEVAAWRLLDLRRTPAMSVFVDITARRTPRDPSIATAISIHGPPHIPA